jgi:transposase
LPGNHESAGKHKSGKTSKGTYLYAQYRRLAGRRGSKRAAVAVAHSIPVAIYYILKLGVEYQDLGGNHFGGLDHEKTRQRLMQRLKRMGYDVQI